MIVFVFIGDIINIDHTIYFRIHLINTQSRLGIFIAHSVFFFLIVFFWNFLHFYLVPWSIISFTYHINSTDVELSLWNLAILGSSSYLESSQNVLELGRVSDNSTIDDNFVASLWCFSIKIESSTHLFKIVGAEYLFDFRSTSLMQIKRKRWFKIIFWHFLILNNKLFYWFQRTFHCLISWHFHNFFMELVS